MNGILPLVLLGAALALLALSYRRTVPATGRGFRILGFAARTLAFLLLILAILDPALTMVRWREDPAEVAVLLDRSLSMSLPSGEEAEPAGTPPGTAATPRTRWDEARTLVSGGDGLLAQLSRRGPVRFYTFDSALREETGDPNELGDPRGGASDLAGALRQARHELGSRLAGVVLVSDGMTTGSSDAVAAGRETLVPVNTILVGAETEPADLAVVSTSAPDLAYLDSRVTVSARVRSTGFAGETIPVVLRDESGTVDSVSVAAPEDGGEAAVALHFVPDAPGARRLTVSVPRHEGELVSANNERHLLITVAREKIRVLYLEPVPRWDYTFLHRTLATDEGLRVETAFLSADARRGGRPVPVLPREETLRDVDVLILGNFPMERLRPDEVKRLSDFVERRGGGLLLLGGEDAFAVSPPPELADLLPWRRTGGGGLRDGAFLARITSEGEDHPVTRLAEDAGASRLLWAGLPPLAARNSGIRALPGADVLLESTDRSGGEALPLLLVHRAGAGKTAALTAATFWRWEFVSLGLGRSSDAYTRLMTNLVRWLAAREDADLVRAAPEKPIYRYGESPRFTARVFDGTLSPRSGAWTTLEITPADMAGAPAGGDSGSVREPVVLEEVEGAPGTYRAQLAPLPPGRYHYRARASWGGEVLGEDEGDLDVVEQSVEFERLGTNPELLRAIAAETGGRFLHAADAASLPASVDVTPKRRREAQELRFGRHPTVFLSMVLLLAFEWTWRRRRGLW